MGRLICDVAGRTNHIVENSRRGSYGEKEMSTVVTLSINLMTSLNKSESAVFRFGRKRIYVF